MYKLLSYKYCSYLFWAENQFCDLKTRAHFLPLTILSTTNILAHEEHGWTVFTKLLSFGGVLPLHGSYRNYLISCVFSQSVFILIVIQNPRWTSTISSFGIVGIECEVYQYFLNSAKEVIMCLWILVNSKSLVKAVKILSECEKRISCGNNFNHFDKNLNIYLICITIFELNIFLIKFRNSRKISDVIIGDYSLIMITFEIDYFRNSLILTFYTALVCKIQEIIEQINKRLEAPLTCFRRFERNNREIVTLINTRNRLIRLCVNEISYFFGICILLISMELFFEFIQAPFYLTYELSMNFEMDIFRRFTMILWCSPKIVVFLRAFTCNSIGKEVSSFLCNPAFLQLIL